MFYRIPSQRISSAECVATFGIAALFVGLFLVGTPAFSADTPQPGKAYKAPRTEHGQPDLQGNWTNATITPIERPESFGERVVLTPEEAAGLEKAEADFVEAGAQPTDPGKGIKDLPVNCRPGFSGTNCGYNNFWVDSGTQVVRIDGEPRASITTFPTNGKIPPLTAEAQKKRAERMAAFRSGGVGQADGPEVRTLGERCLMSFGSSAGPPMLPLLYNNNYQIVQTRDAVTILVEMVHDARIVRLGGDRLPANVRPWMGDSVGHWEGDTLVVETVSINPMQLVRSGGSPAYKVTERFTRSAPNTIHYQFTVDDPATYTSRWSGELNMNATRDPLYEYACHEGNYALPGILAGAREEERAAAAAGKK